MFKNEANSGVTKSDPAHNLPTGNSQSATPQSLVPALKSLEQPHLSAHSVEAVSCSSEELAVPYTNTHALPDYTLRDTSETAPISMDLHRQIWEQTSLDYQQRDEIYINFLKFCKDSHSHINYVSKKLETQYLKLGTIHYFYPLILLSSQKICCTVF